MLSHIRRFVLDQVAGKRRRTGRTRRKPGRKLREHRRLVTESLEERSLMSAAPVTAVFQDGVSGYTGTADTRIASKSPTANYGTANYLAADGKTAAMVKWDLSSIPADAVVESASLSLYITNTTTGTYDLYALNRAWSESQATWKNASAGDPWQVAGAKGTADRGTTVLGTVTARATGPATVTLNAAGVAMVQSWIQDPGSNYGFILQDYGETNDIQFRSKEMSTISRRPALQVTYTVGAQQNQAPVVSAGADQSVTLPSTAILDGTVTDDGLPNPPAQVTAAWTKVSGPGTVNFANAAAVDTTANFSTAGSYVVRLTASDGALTSSDDLAITVTAAPTNQAPVADAGADQTVTLGQSVSLNAVCADDGLPNPPGDMTMSWTKVSGPGAVTFANPTVDNTTAAFSAAGTYVLRMTADDGQLTGSDDMTVTVSNAVSQGSGIWISHDEIMALPTSGTAWEKLLAEANSPVGTPNIADQTDNADMVVLAKALAGVRTGNQTMIDEARAGIMAAINTENGGTALALARNLASYVIAADIAGLTSSQDTTFRSWLRSVLTEDLSGRTLQSTHEDRPNNWGTMAGASRAAVAIYLGDQAELARTAQVFKGWVGDRSSYAGFDFGGPYEDLSWQADPNNPVAINPKGAMKEGHSIDGVLPEEMRRGGSFDWPPQYVNYCWGTLQGAFTQAEILYRAGYDTYQWQDQALLRAVEWLYDQGWVPTGDDQWQPWLINARYGTHFDADPASRNGKIMGWTNWTHQNLGGNASTAAASTSEVFVASSALAPQSTATGTSEQPSVSATMALREADVPRDGATHATVTDQVLAVPTGSEVDSQWDSAFLTSLVKKTDDSTDGALDDLLPVLDAQLLCELAQK